MCAGVTRVEIPEAISFPFRGDSSSGSVEFTRRHVWRPCPPQTSTTPMFSMKYKVRRNDTTATTRLGSTHPPEKGRRRVCGSSAFRNQTGFNGGNEMSIWTILFVVLLIAWLGGFTVFHVAGGLIHLLLVFAVISLILHFVLGTRAA